MLVYLMYSVSKVVLVTDFSCYFKRLKYRGPAQMACLGARGPHDPALLSCVRLPLRKAGKGWRCHGYKWALNGPGNFVVKFENQAYPASLSSSGEIYKTWKDELMHCLVSIAATRLFQDEVESIAIDWSCFAHTLKPKDPTFQDYAMKTFVRNINTYGRTHRRDIVCTLDWQ